MFKKMIIYSFFVVLIQILYLVNNAHAENTIIKNAINDGQIAEKSVIIEFAEKYIVMLVDYLGGVLFYNIPVINMPFLVLWLLVGGLFFTIRLGFINIRLFGHAIAVVRGKYSSKDDSGEISHFQALAAAVSATVGLGNIGGVALAVAVGGPGAVIWMVFAGFLGMSSKFAEVTMGQKYRKFDENGRVSGGAFHYLKDGLAEKGFVRLGKILAVIFAFFCIGGALGGGNMYQANQAVSILTNSFSALDKLDMIIAMFFSVSVGIVLIGGIRRIARVAEATVPFMAFIYLSAALVVLFVNADKIPAAFSIMFSSAFNLEAAGGGMLGAIIQGVKRAAFSSEAGLGSAPIAHAAAKSKLPVREGSVALLEPFIDTVIICFMTGLVIVVTGVYVDSTINDGVLLTSQAFATVIDWFPKILSVAVVLFAYSTMITWSYYGDRAWSYLFGRKYITLYHIIFVTATFIGGIVSLEVVINLSDLLLLSMAIPNLLGLYILSKDIKQDTDSYVKKLKSGEFEGDKSEAAKK